MSRELKTLSSALIHTHRPPSGVRLALLLALLTLSGSMARAATDTPEDVIQDIASLTRAAEDWLGEEARARYPGLDIEARVTPPDTRLRLSPCPRPSFVLPTGSTLWGSGNLGLRCDAPNPWSLFSAYRIRVQGNALVAKRDLNARQRLDPADFEGRRVDFEAAPEQYAIDPASLSGTQLARPLAAGVALRGDMLRRAMLVKAGQKVRVTIEGPGFRVGQEAVAQQAGGVGESIRLKTTAGRIIQGRIEADGGVRVQP
jgi:flagella basal body P-ring formation protein FlgA